VPNSNCEILFREVGFSDKRSNGEWTIQNYSTPHFAPVKVILRIYLSKTASMRNLSLLCLFLCFGFQYDTAQQVDGSKVKSIIKDTTRRAIPPPPPPPKEEIIFRVVENISAFPGCESKDSVAERKKCSESKVQEFIRARIEYSLEAKENRIEGVCLVSFRVKKNGKIDEVELEKDIGGKCRQEVLRVINLMILEMPYWIPSMGARKKGY